MYNYNNSCINMAPPENEPIFTYDVGSSERSLLKKTIQSIKKEQLASLIHRGTRLDESVVGHGLGLSIVNDIVKLYSGAIEFKDSSSLGGLQVNITIDIN